MSTKFHDAEALAASWLTQDRRASDDAPRPEMVAFGIGSAVGLAERLARDLSGDAGCCWQEAHRHLQVAHAAAKRAVYASVGASPPTDVQELEALLDEVFRRRRAPIMFCGRPPEDGQINALYPAERV